MHFLQCDCANELWQTITTSESEFWLFFKTCITYKNIERWLNTDCPHHNPEKKQRYCTTRCRGWLEYDIVSVLWNQDVKMKRLAARHVTSTTSVHSRQAVHRQLRQWDSNLHRLRLSHYRYACYVASLHNVELPNSLVLHSHWHRFEFVTSNLIKKIKIVLKVVIFDS